MIEEHAEVLRIDGDRAEIAAIPQPACSRCSAKGGCGTSLVASLFPRRRPRFWLDNGIGASPGDRVVIGLDERRLQQGSLLLYALPLLGLLLGAVAGEAAFAATGLPAELGAIMSGLMGLIVTLALARRLSTGDSKQGDGGVRLLRVLRPSHAVAPAELLQTRVRLLE